MLPGKRKVAAITNSKSESMPGLPTQDTQDPNKLRPSHPSPSPLHEVFSSLDNHNVSSLQQGP